MGDLTNNISYSELKPNGSPITWKPEFPIQDLMIKTLAKNIQIVLDTAKCHANFASGVRTSGDYDRLMQLGYNPSATSDHFCGNVVSLDPVKQLAKYKQYGSHYMFSVGAADTIPTGIIIKDFFKLAIKLNKAGTTNFGQIIHEIDPDKKTEWVHLSNNMNAFFSKDVCNMFPRPPYQYTVDGGKTYNDYI